MNTCPDYKSYSDNELFEALESIDKKSFPERLKLINEEITSRSISISTYLESEVVSQLKDSYTPNEVPIWEQIKNVLLSITVIIFGGMGVLENDLAVKVCRHCESVYHLKDEAAWVMYGAMLLMAASFISEVVDHYDKRNNEHIYHRISNLTSLPGLGLFVLAMYMHAQ